MDTPNGTISRVVLIDDKPLSPAQQIRRERAHPKMLDPALMRRKLKEQQEDDERTRKMLATIPNAFDFNTPARLPRPTATNSPTSNLPPVPASIRPTAKPWSSPQCRAKCWWTKPPIAWQKSTARSSRTSTSAGEFSAGSTKVAASWSSRRGHALALGNHQNDPALRRQGASVQAHPHR